MISKNKISEMCKLHLKKFREETQSFIVEGTKSVSDLLQSELTILEIFASEKWLEYNAAFIQKVPSVSPVSEKEMERISCLKSPQEVLAVVKNPAYPVSQIEGELPLLVLDDIRDPGNLGTIIRTADWFGLKQIVCSATCVEFTNPKVIQATMGSFCRMKVVYTDLPEFLTERSKKSTLYGSFMEGTPIQEVHFAKNATLIIGNESNGISARLQEIIPQKIHIPSFASSASKAESLNASIATAICLYQFRQRAE